MVNSHLSSLYTVLFYFIATATTELYTLSLHDALPIYPQADRRNAGDRELPSRQVRQRLRRQVLGRQPGEDVARPGAGQVHRDRKSTRLNSSHVKISYAVFCLKKKKTTNHNTTTSTLNT